MASSILMSNSKQNSNCVPASLDAGFLSTITNSKPNPTSNSNCTLVIENQALKVTNLTPDAVPLRANVKPLATVAGSPPPLHVVIPPSKPMILVKEVSLPSPSSFNSSASSELSRKEAAKNHQVRVCGWKECKAVARSLAEAFKDDELSFYWLRTDDATHRSEADIWKLHVKVCEYVVAAHCMHGLVLSIGENHEGVALWMPPGRDYDDVWSIFRSGMWRLYYQLTKEGRRRYFKETLGLAAVTKVDILGDRDASSWYLTFLGTLPAARGLGYSRKLVEYVTRIADETNAACYLESSHHSNRKIYERFGFEYKRTVHLERVNKGAKPLPWEIMVREPTKHVVCTSVPTGKEA
ncbi:hypothetical protein TWF730_000939 [Orbilia blumenaviensis]|uniref:N-acetyltransferase domain-containing protein n=1 Tax=Orbilia blumenaviensis TaxID=1796055 RepID=A0AAV9VNA1_9PEZI